MAFGGDPRDDRTRWWRRCARRRGCPSSPSSRPTSATSRSFARAAEEAGADALSCINTLLGLAIDVETRRPRLGFGTGGLSGPAIRPVAVRMAWQAARAVRIPVIGIGGIASAQRRARVPDRRLPRGPDRHRELRRSRHLRAHPGRPRAPTSSATGWTTSTPWWARSSTPGCPGPATERSRMNAARPPDRRPRRPRRPTPRAPSSTGLGRPRGHVQGRQPALHRRRARPRPRDRGPRRARLPRPQVPRHPEHRRRRGRERRAPGRLARGRPRPRRARR